MTVIEWLDENVIQPLFADKLAVWGTVGSAVGISTYFYLAWSDARQKELFDRSQFEGIYPVTAIPPATHRGTQVIWTTLGAHPASKGPANPLKLFRDEDVLRLRRIVRSQLRAAAIGLPGKIIFVCGPEILPGSSSRFVRHALGFPFLFGKTLPKPLMAIWEARMNGKPIATSDWSPFVAFSNYLDANPETVGLEAIDPLTDPPNMSTGRVDLSSWSTADPRVWLAATAAVNPRTSLFAFLRFMVNRLVSLLFANAFPGLFAAPELETPSALGPILSQAHALPYDTPRDHTTVLAALQASLESVNRRWIAPNMNNSGLIMFDHFDTGVVGAAAAGGGTMRYRMLELFFKHMRNIVDCKRGRGREAESLIACVVPVSGATALKHLAPLVVKGEAIVIGYGDLSRDEAAYLWRDLVNRLGGPSGADSDEVFDAVFEIFGGRSSDLVGFAEYLLSLSPAWTTAKPQQLISSAASKFPDAVSTKRFIERVLASSLPEEPEPESTTPAEYIVELAKDPVGDLPLFNGPGGDPWNPRWTREQCTNALQFISSRGCATYLSVIAEIGGSRPDEALHSLIANGVVAYRPASGMYVDFEENVEEDCCTLGRPMVAWVVRKMLAKQ